MWALTLGGLDLLTLEGLYGMGPTMGLTIRNHVAEGVNLGARHRGV